MPMYPFEIDQQLSKGPHEALHIAVCLNQIRIYWGSTELVERCCRQYLTNQVLVGGEG